MENNIDTSKRAFLKKAAYSAPVIVGLGSLTNASAHGRKMGHSCFTMGTKFGHGIKFGHGTKFGHGGMFGKLGKGHHKMSPSTSNYKNNTNMNNFKVCKTFTK